MANVPATVEIVGYGGARTVNGINTGRGANQLILYSTPVGGATGTNVFGRELAVVNGLVTANAVNVNVPTNGYVLSGHGTVADAIVGVPTGTQVIARDSGGAVTTWPVDSGGVDITGARPVSVALAGTMAATRAGAGARSVAVALSGTAEVAGPGTGALTVGAALAGSATVEGTAAGDLPVGAALSGDVDVIAPLPPAERPDVTWAAADVLGGNRVTGFRFELLTGREQLIGELLNVTDAELNSDAYASVKVTGTLTMRDLTGTEPDWTTVRIRPWARISRPDAAPSDIGGVLEFPLGVYLCAAPDEEWRETGRGWRIELADKLAVLDQDIASGVPAPGVSSYAADVGANVIELVRDLIEETGEETPAIEPAALLLTSPLTWEIGTTRLQVINDLLDAIGYASLWCDGYGQYRAELWQHPRDRTPAYTGMDPFVFGATSLMTPDWVRGRDIYSIPNRFVCIGQGDGETEALVGVATNVDPDDPLSYPRRGRWITAVEEGVEAIDQSVIDSLAQTRLQQRASVSTSLELHHVLLPDLWINSVLEFVNPWAGLDIRCYVLRQQIPLSPTGLVTTTANVVG